MKQHLIALVEEARQSATLPCSRLRHRWVQEGGRSCPHGVFGSQPVYQCSVCGEYDYGYPGGPGHMDCVTGDCGCIWHEDQQLSG